MIETNNQGISVRQQCRLLGVDRSGLYYERTAHSPENLDLMRLLDEQYTRTPFYGVRPMQAVLQSKGHEVNAKRVRRLLRLMGLEAVYPKPSGSMPVPVECRYPYLLRGLQIERPNQVWCTDITYVRLRDGFGYLVAVMDWYSRYVLAWEVSNRLDAQFCVQALERALERGRPEIFNNDQGSQFTCAQFVGVLKRAGARISWDGRGRAFDNIFIERHWLTIKYESIYLHEHTGIPSLRAGLVEYYPFYNEERPHQALDYKTPRMVYEGR